MSVSVKNLPIEVEQGELVTRYAEFDEMAIRHATLPPGTDMGPVLAGLPGGRCPSPHWGIILSGSIEITHADGSTEVAQEGDLYYWAAGHTGVSKDGVTFVEIGPTGPMRAFSEHAKQLFA